MPALWSEEWRWQLARDPLIDQSDKSHSAPVQYPTIHQSKQNVHISVLNGVLWDMEQVHCGMCLTDLLIDKPGLDRRRVFALCGIKVCELWDLSCPIRIQRQGTLIPRLLVARVNYIPGLNMHTRTMDSENNYLGLLQDHTHCLLFVFVPGKSCRRQLGKFVLGLTNVGKVNKECITKGDLHLRDKERDKGTINNIKYDIRQDKVSNCYSSSTQTFIVRVT